MHSASTWHLGDSRKGRRGPVIILGQSCLMAMQQMLGEPRNDDAIDRVGREGGLGHHPLTKIKSMPCEQLRPILSVLYRSQGMGSLLPTPPKRPSGAMGTNTRLDCPGAGILEPESLRVKSSLPLDQPHPPAVSPKPLSLQKFRFPVKKGSGPIHAENLKRIDHHRFVWKKGLLAGEEGKCRLSRTRTRVCPRGRRGGVR